MEQILLSIGLMLLCAKILGNIFERFGIASLVGEILAGVILGPILGFVILGSFLTGFMTISVIFLMFIAGMEVKFEDIRDNTYKASIIAIGGGIVSFLMGFAVGMLFLDDFVVAVAIGTVVISTSNSALFLVLMRSGKFDTKIGKLIIATTIADDVVGILALAFFKMYLNASISFFSLFTILLVSLGFYLFILTVASKAFTKIINKLHMFKDENMLFAIPISIMLFLAFITDNLGLSLAAGAFLAGMAISNSHFADPVIAPKVGILTHGFLLPLFYASIGTLLIFSGLNLALVAALVICAMVAKVIGCGLTSKIFGFSNKDARLIGMSMMPRGDENVAILQLLVIIVGITTTIYTSVIFAIITTTILSPILVKFVISRE